MTVQKSTFLRPLLVIITTIPVLLFAYLGSFSQMMSDDYCFVAVGHEYGGWGGTVYWFHTWEGSYSAFFWRSSFAVFDTAMPALMPSIVLVLWVIALVWLLNQVLDILNINPRGILSLVLANLVVFVTINALHSYQSFYWYAATVEYTLPLPLMTALIAFMVYSIRHFQSSTMIGVSVLAVGILSFLVGGFAESHVVFQFTLFVLAFVAVTVVYRLTHKHILMLLGVGAVGSLLSLIVQLTAPGMSVRYAVELERNARTAPPLFDLVLATIGATFEHTSERVILGGFSILFIVMLVSTVLFYTPKFTKSASKSFKLSPLSISLWVLLQLAFVPVLLAQTSNATQILGRYSYAYFAAILINVSFIVIGLVLLITHQRINRWLSSNPKHLYWIYGMIFAVLGMLITITQLTALDKRVVIFITYSVIVMLLLLMRHLAAVFENRQITLVVYLVIGIGFGIWVLSSSIISASIFGAGRATERILPPIAYSLILFGALSGFMFGILLKSLYQNDRLLSDNRVTSVMALAVLGCVIIIAGSLIGHLQDAENFQSYATAWQARHEEIIKQREAGQSPITVNPLSFNLEDQIGLVDLSTDPANRCAERYYGVPSILVAG